MHLEIFLAYFAVFRVFWGISRVRDRANYQKPCLIHEQQNECVTPENIHTPPMEGIGNSGGLGGSQRPKNLCKCMKLDWNFQRGGRGGGSREKSLPWGRYGYNFWNHTINLDEKFLT